MFAGKGASQTAEEESLKSYFIFNFIKYINWPPEALSDYFTISVYKSDKFTGRLREIAAQQKLKSMPVQIKIVNSLEEAASSHVIVIPEENSNYFSKIFQNFSNSPVLLITEKKGLGREGASINMRVTNNKIRFSINKTSIDNHGLSVSAKLLNLALEVY